jgi:hypothetical protein
MLSPGDAALLEAYAKECDDRGQATLCKVPERQLPSAIVRAHDPDQTARQAARRKRPHSPAGVACAAIALMMAVPVLNL